MPNPIDTFFGSDIASNPIVLGPFTPVNGQLLVVLSASWDTSNPTGSPTGGAQTYTPRVTAAPGGFNGYSRIDSAVVSGSPGAMSVTVPPPTGNTRHSAALLRYPVGCLPGAVNAVSTGAGAPSANVTTGGSNSGIAQVSVDVNSVDPATRVYRNSAVEVGILDGHVGSNSVQYHAYVPNVGAAGTYAIGLSAPGGEQWVLAALEILAASSTTVTGSASVLFGDLTVVATGTVTKLGSATVGLGGLSVAAMGKRTAVGVATVNLGRLITSASAITGGPVILADDFYSPGPCRPYDYVSACVIPTEAMAISGYALQAASEILYYASGQRFDTCQVTIRPCRKECSGDGWPRLSAGWWEFGGGPVPALINGLWYNIACGFCGTNCSCSIVSETMLPGPVREIVQVTVDGVVLDPVSDYRLDDYRKLVRLGGEVWPLCNDLNKGITETGTWSVTAIYGEPLPKLGMFAMGQLLCQIITDTLGGDCALPDNVTNITRQGLSFTLDDVQQAVESGFDELKYVNKFIARFNPHKLMARARLYDVDGPDFRVTGTVIS